MSPAHVLEPTYRRLKQGLMEGEWSPDERLEAQRLADDFGVSMTPVRDSLNRLAGEGLVILRPGEGYRVPRLSEKNVRDMFALSDIVLAAALTDCPNDMPGQNEDMRGGTYADRIAALFHQIALAFGNERLLEVVDGLSVRLHVLRLIEPSVIESANSELARLESKWNRRDHGLGQALADYHRCRIELAETLVARLS